MEAVGLGLGLGAGVLVLAALALSELTARVGRGTAGEDGLPLVGSRQAQFGDASSATSAARGARAGERARAGRPLRLVHKPGDTPDGARSSHPVRAA